MFPRALLSLPLSESLLQLRNLISSLTSLILIPTKILPTLQELMCKTFSSTTPAWLPAGVALVPLLGRSTGHPWTRAVTCVPALSPCLAFYV